VVEIDGLTGGTVPNAVQWDPAVGVPVVLAVGDDDVVEVESPACVEIAVSQGQLRGDRIRLDIDTKGSGQMLFAQISGSAHVEQGVTLAIQQVERLRGEAPAGFGSRRESDRPAITEPNIGRGTGNVSHRIGAVVGHGILLRIVRPPQVILDVPHVVAEGPKAAEPVQEHPRLPAVRAPADVTEHDEAPSLHGIVPTKAPMSLNEMSRIC
jgi:hypothetical protein